MTLKPELVVVPQITLVPQTIPVLQITQVALVELRFSLTDLDTES